MILCYIMLYYTILCYGQSPYSTNIMYFRGFDSSIILIIRGGIPMSIGDSLGKFESSNLSRDNVSREIGRSPRGC